MSKNKRRQQKKWSFLLSKAEKMQKQIRKQQKRMGKSSIKKFMQAACLAGALTIGLAGNALALPTDGQITQGQGTITLNGQQMTIDQATNNLNLNWQSFNIGLGETVKFNQPSVNSVAINNILGNQASEIYGNLTANGKVFLINPNGILFGKTAQVDVGGLVASTLKTNDGYTFSKNGISGTVTNQGKITAGDGGYVALLGQKVVNEGVIIANKGSVALGAGDQATLDFTGDGLINLTVSNAALNAQVENKNLIQADGGLVVMTAKAAGDLAGTVINNSGIIRAQGLTEKNGKIMLDGGDTGWVQVGNQLDVSGQNNAGGDVKITGQTVSLTGDINADGKNAGNINIIARGSMEQSGTLSAVGREDGGNINLTVGNNVLQTTSAKLDVTGNTGGSINQAAGNQIYTSANYLAKGAIGGNINLSGNTIKFMGATADASATLGNGGTITIGGGLAGAAVNNQANAKTVVVSSQSSLKADGGTSGGKIVVWSDQDTAFAGSLSAQGGRTGGKIEVSSKENLLFAGDITSTGSNPASLLLDPKNITIAASGGLDAFAFADPNPGSSNAFGTSTVALSTGNIVVTSPGDSFAASSAGAVYLFNGSTGALISTLRGSTALDNVGGGGVTVLTNGNYVVNSYNWSDGAAVHAGAVTWGNGNTGVNGIITSGNSLVGSTANDKVGSWGITALTNGNYVVRSSSWDNGAIQNVGAITWGNGNTGISGVVSSSNSLVGSKQDDLIGNVGVTALTNGNYVVASKNWDNGAIVDAGAATWGNGSMGIIGVVGSGNSLVGSTANDLVGFDGVTALTNGNYVVDSSHWNNGGILYAGAVTWCDGTNGRIDTVGIGNSLIGSKVNDMVGYSSQNKGVTALANGNYVVDSSSWDNGAIVDAGAVTWCSGSTGRTGTITSGNSLVGSKASDSVGSGGVTALNNGNYVVRTSYWDNGAIQNVGAVTWGDGDTGVSGAVSSKQQLGRQYGGRSGR